MTLTATRYADSVIKRVMYALKTSVKSKHVDAFVRYNGVAKMWNFLRVELGIRRKQISGFGFPYLLTVEPTNRCNLQCPLCPTGRGLVGRPKQNLDLDSFKRVIDEIGKYVFMINFQNWGEPMLAKQIGEMIGYCHQRRIATAICTNGNYPTKLNQKLIEANLDHVSIAVDGSDQQLYQEYRVGGKLDLVKQNLIDLVTRRNGLGKKRPFVELQFLVFQHNAHDIDNVKRLGRECNVDGTMIRAAVAPNNDGIRARFYTWNDEKDFCRRFWYTATLNANSGITPCCNFFHERDDLGNVRRGTFASVWNGAAYRDNRRAVANRDYASLHANCKACKKYDGALGCKEYGVLTSLD